MVRGSANPWGWGCGHEVTIERNACRLETVFGHGPNPEAKMVIPDKEWAEMSPSELTDRILGWNRDVCRHLRDGDDAPAP